MRLNRRCDSFSSDDELPLKYSVPSCSDDANSYKTFNQPSVIHCEFCDRVFDNNYESLIHNASHIIIPLLNQKLIQCKECLFFFASVTDYERHTKKHITPNEVKSIRKGKEGHRLRNRIKFEDDIVNNPNGLLKDLTTECKVNLNSVLDISNYKTEPDGQTDAPLAVNKLILGSESIPVNIHLNDSCTNGLDEAINRDGEVNGDFKSISYDELISPRKVRCKHCHQKFTNTYNLIIHETCHLNIDRSLPHMCAACDWYIGSRSDLKRHRRSHSPKSRKKVCFPCTKKCLQCGLLYRSYIHHIRNYHSDVEDEKFDMILRVCDLCYQFLKSARHRSYVKIGTVSKIGKRYTCSRCMRKFFELNQVKKTELIQNWCVDKPRCKKLTNNQRLKNIQHRLKRINNLRKF